MSGSGSHLSNRSGLEWAPNIPEDWDIARLSSRYEVLLGKMLSPEATAGPYQRPYVGNVHVQWDRVQTGELPTMSVSPGELERYRLRLGDLLICEGGEVGRTAVWREEHEGCCYQKALHRVRSRRKSEVPRFLYYLMVAATGLGVFEAGGNRSTIIHLTGEKLRAHRFPFPPSLTQQRIADFLDRKTAAIDELIAKKKRLIALLAEKRQSALADLITRSCATLGGGFVPPWAPGCQLDKQLAPRLGHIARIGNGSTPTREEERFWTESSTGLPWMNSGRINDGRIEHADQRVTDTALRECHLPRVPRGSVLVAITGEGQTRGRTAMLNLDATISQHLAYVIPRADRLRPEFLWRQMQCMYAWLRDESAGGGSTRAALTCEFLRTVPVLTPPLRVQDQVVADLHTVLSRLNDVTLKTESSIERLREYRQALTTAAVTGQIDLSREAA